QARLSHLNLPEKTAMMLVSVYGGYFNGGLGIILLSVFSALGKRDLNVTNGLKAWLSFALSAISVATFAIAGIIAWREAGVMMVASTIGGYAGAQVARALPRPVMRGLIVAVGLGMSAVFFWRLAG
ncbi:MAG TPA: sulfite exporter TauE/SafE family protein, partial [Rhizobiales bacterium]|nr:sulfite exporter TauE/SafE family protein [Hyphomicrobiales bacterium]